MAKNEHKRAELLQVVNLVKPALATTPYIPALNHIHFANKYATAYNDITAIAVRADLGVKACVPGLIFAAALNSFSGTDVLIQELDGNTLKVSSGRGNIKVPVMPASSFPYEEPNRKDGIEIELGADTIKGVERCLFSVGTDAEHPEQMGVTLDEDNGKAVLYSTDNKTVSRYQTKDKIKLPGGTPVVLPTFFCHQLIALHKAYGGKVWLTVFPSALLADFGNENDDAYVFTKMIIEGEVLDFKQLIDRDVGTNEKLMKSTSPIPDAWDAALSRAMLVLGQELVKATEITPDGSEKAQLKTSAQLGDADDKLTLPVDTDGASVLVDASLLLRGSKSCTAVLINEKMTIMTNDDCSFIHLVAHIARPKK